MPNINLYKVMFKVGSSGCKLNKFESSLETNVGAAKFYELRVFSLLQAKGHIGHITLLLLAAQSCAILK